MALGVPVSDIFDSSNNCIDHAYFVARDARR